MKRKTSRLIIVERRRSTNNFGDIFLECTVEIRGQNQEVVATKTLTETESEGCHDSAYRMMQYSIKTFAKEHHAVCTAKF